jgi:hypothetical protein
MSSAVPTIYVAVDGAILADSTIMAVLVDRGVYAAGDVPDNQPVTDGVSRFGYVEIGTSRETHANLLGTEGRDDGLRLTVRATSKRWALIIYRHLERILDGKALPSGVMSPDSFADYIQSLEFIEDFAEPDGAHAAVGDYRVSVVSTA